jgi:uncharacterized protein YndB with AHSA1/START domain
MNVIEPSMSDEAVEAKTGRAWAEWFAILDAAGAQQMSHKQIVALLSEGYGVGAWWQQMVTVTYEQARGLRGKHEMPSGYQISRSKTLDAPLEKVFVAWAEESQRSRWLAEPNLTLRKATPGKNARFTWVDGQSAVEARFTPKGADRTQVSVQHDKLADAAQAEKMKAYWSEALENLERWLAGS